MIIFSVANCSSLVIVTGSVIALTQVMISFVLENLDSAFVKYFYHKYNQTEFSLFHYFLPISFYFREINGKSSEESHSVVL